MLNVYSRQLFGHLLVIFYIVNADDLEIADIQTAIAQYIDTQVLKPPDDIIEILILLVIANREANRPQEILQRLEALLADAGRVDKATGDAHEIRLQRHHLSITRCRNLLLLGPICTSVICTKRSGLSILVELKGTWTKDGR